MELFLLIAFIIGLFYQRNLSPGRFFVVYCLAIFSLVFFIFSTQEDEYSVIFYFYSYLAKFFGLCIGASVISLWKTHNTLKATVGALVVAINIASCLLYISLEHDFHLFPIIEHSWNNRNNLNADRYLHWCITTCIFVYEVAMLAGLQTNQYFLPMAADVIMIVTGYFAFWCDLPFGYIWLLVSVLSFIYIMMFMFNQLEVARENTWYPEDRSFIQALRLSTLISWSVFPTITMLDALEITSKMQSELMLVFADNLCKVWYTVSLVHNNYFTHTQLKELQRIHSEEIYTDTRKTMKKLCEASSLLWAAIKDASENFEEEFLEESFLSEMAHNLRTPLNSIIAFNNTLLQSTDKVDDEQQVLATLASAEGLLSNIDDILAFAGLQKGLTIKIEKFMIPSLVAQLSNIALKATSRNSELLLDYDTQLEKICLLGDPNLLKNALDRIVEMCYKHTSNEDDILVNVSIAKRIRNLLMLDITIKGGGVFLYNLEKVEKVAKEITASRDVGFSLLITRQIIEKMNGTFVIERDRSEISYRIQIGFDIYSNESFDEFWCEPFSMATNFKSLQKTIILDKWMKQYGIEHFSQVSLHEAQQKHCTFYIVDRSLLDLDIRKGYPSMNIVILDTNIYYPVHPNIKIYTKPIVWSQFITFIMELPSSKKRPNLSTFKVLVVEDNLMNQKVAKTILNKIGVRITMVGDGRQAVDILLNEKFDLVLMDLNMPVMDGIEATKEIRRLERKNEIQFKNYICALTANATKADEENCLNAGMDSYMTKPIYFNQLQDLIIHLTK